MRAEHHELEGAVQDGSYSIPFGKADIKRAGRDVTVVATSLMVSRSVEVADQLAETGIEVEVIDPRTLVPFDSDTIIASVLRTGRLVVVDECHRSCGVAAEIVTRVVEEAFHALKAPVKRVTTADVPVAFSGSLEEAIAPTSQKIADAVRTVMCKAF